MAGVSAIPLRDFGSSSSSASSSSKDTPLEKHLLDLVLVRMHVLAEVFKKRPPSCSFHSLSASEREQASKYIQELKAHIGFDMETVADILDTYDDDFVRKNFEHLCQLHDRWLSRVEDLEFFASLSGEELLSQRNTIYNPALAVQKKHEFIPLQYSNGTLGEAEIAYSSALIEEGKAKVALEFVDAESTESSTKLAGIVSHRRRIDIKEAELERATLKVQATKKNLQDTLDDWLELQKKIEGAPTEFVIREKEKEIVLKKAQLSHLQDELRSEAFLVNSGFHGFVTLQERQKICIAGRSAIDFSLVSTQSEIDDIHQEKTKTDRRVRRAEEELADCREALSRAYSNLSIANKLKSDKEGQSAAKSTIMEKTRTSRAELAHFIEHERLMVNNPPPRSAASDNVGTYLERLEETRIAIRALNKKIDALQNALIPIERSEKRAAEKIEDALQQIEIAKGVFHKNKVLIRSLEPLQKRLGEDLLKKESHMKELYARSRINEEEREAIKKEMAFLQPHIDRIARCQQELDDLHEQNETLWRSIS